jgi:hypothetical protein
MMRRRKATSELTMVGIGNDQGVVAWQAFGVVSASQFTAYANFLIAIRSLNDTATMRSAARILYFAYYA